MPRRVEGDAARRGGAAQRPLTQLLHARGRLRLAQGDPAAALDDLREVSRGSGRPLRATVHGLRRGYAPPRRSTRSAATTRRVRESLAARGDRPLFRRGLQPSARRCASTAELTRRRSAPSTGRRQVARRPDTARARRGAGRSRRDDATARRAARVARTAARRTRARTRMRARAAWPTRPATSSRQAASTSNAATSPAATRSPPASDGSPRWPPKAPPTRRSPSRCS